jgi:hypothetical protein
MVRNVCPLCYCRNISEREVKEMEELTTIQTTVCQTCGDVLTVWEQGVCILCED